MRKPSGMPTSAATPKPTATRLRDDRMFQPIPLVVGAVAVERVGEQHDGGVQGLAGRGSPTISSWQRPEADHQGQADQRRQHRPHEVAEMFADGRRSTKGPAPARRAALGGDRPWRRVRSGSRSISAAAGASRPRASVAGHRSPYIQWRRWRSPANMGADGRPGIARPAGQALDLEAGGVFLGPCRPRRRRR